MSFYSKRKAAVPTRLPSYCSEGMLPTVPTRQATFSPAVANIDDTHIIIAHFADSDMYSIIMKKWMKSDTISWCCSDNLAKNALQKKLDKDRNNKSWSVYKVNIFLKKEGDGKYSPIVYPTYGEANKTLNEMMSNTASFGYLSDNTKPPMMSKCHRVTTLPSVRFQSLKLLQLTSLTFYIPNW